MGNYYVFRRRALYSVCYRNRAAVSCRNSVYIPAAAGTSAAGYISYNKSLAFNSEFLAYHINESYDQTVSAALT